MNNLPLNRNPLDASRFSTGSFTLIAGETRFFPLAGNRVTVLQCTAPFKFAFDRSEVFSDARMGMDYPTMDGGNFHGLTIQNSSATNPLTVELGVGTMAVRLPPDVRIIAPGQREVSNYGMTNTMAKVLDPLPTCRKLRVYVTSGATAWLRFGDLSLSSFYDLAQASGVWTEYEWAGQVNCMYNSGAATIIFERWYY